MKKKIFNPIQIIRDMHSQREILGWQYEMIYLGGDPENPEQAFVQVRVLEKAIIVRALDGKEETFCSMLIPYRSVIAVRLKDSQTGQIRQYGEKSRVGECFDTVLLQYTDSGAKYELELRMSMDAEVYKNSRLCRNMQEFVMSRIRKNR